MCPLLIIYKVNYTTAMEDTWRKDGNNLPMKFMKFGSTNTRFA